MEKKSKRTVTWRGVRLGKGLPKVCVSVMGKSIEALRASAERAMAAGAQILELRADSLCASPEISQAVDACGTVRSVCGDVPLLFTLRTVRDGGAGSDDAAAYEALLRGVAKAGVCDAIDVELSVGEEAFVRIAETVHAAGLSVVGSSHEFGEIGDVSKAAWWLLRQEALGADICKAAVMPGSCEQAFALMLEMVRAGEKLSVPYAAIVMGQMGVVSRVCAQAMGSCLTFGAAGQASAPGQIEAGALRDMLRIIGGEE